MRACRKGWGNSLCPGINWHHLWISHYIIASYMYQLASYRKIQDGYAQSSTPNTNHCHFITFATRIILFTVFLTIPTRACHCSQSHPVCSSHVESGLNGGLVLTALLVSQHVEEDTQGTQQTVGLLTEEVGSSVTTETLWKWTLWL